MTCSSATQANRYARWGWTWGYQPVPYNDESSATGQQAYDVSGEWDYVVLLATTSMARHSELADHLFTDAPNVKRYTTMFVLDPVRTGSYLPTR